MKIRRNTILITGGTKGIGLEMAKRFEKLGNKVIITGRNEETLEKAKSELKDAAGFICDVSDPEQIEKLKKDITKKFPKLNGLINNAGVMHTIDLQKNQLEPEALTQEIDINVKGPIWMTQTFLPLLKKNKGSFIANVSSGLAYVPLPISPVYCATKAALHSYTQSLREQLRNTRVKVFELAPPATQTELLGTFDEKDMDGIAIMSVEEMIDEFIKGLEKNVEEIRPGQANQLRFMSRFFPGFILKQMSKTVTRMHKAS